MAKWLQIWANIAQVVAVIWTLVFGPRTITRVIRDFRNRILGRINPLTNHLMTLSILIAVLLIVLLGMIARPIFIPLSNPLQEVVPAPSTPTPVSLPSSTTAVSIFYHNSDGKLHMVHLSGDDGWTDYNTGQWIQGNPSVVIDHAGIMRVYYTDTGDDKLHELSWDPSNSSWQVYNMGCWASGNPSVVIDHTGIVRVYYTDAGDGKLHELSWDPSNSSWQVYNTGRWATGSPSAVIDHTGIVRVYYRDRGTSPTSLEEYYLDSSGWHVNNFFDLQYQIAGDPYAIVKQN